MLCSSHLQKAGTLRSAFNDIELPGTQVTISIKLSRPFRLSLAKNGLLKPRLTILKLQLVNVGLRQSDNATDDPLVQVIARLGKEINNKSSVCYWAARNGIPIFCPALTDGSLGDMLYFHSYKSPGLVIDVVGDIRAINDEAIKAAPRKTGIIVLGGGEGCTLRSLICQAQLLQQMFVDMHWSDTGGHSIAVREGMQHQRMFFKWCMSKGMCNAFHLGALVCLKACLGPPATLLPRQVPVWVWCPT